MNKFEKYLKEQVNFDNNYCNVKCQYLEYGLFFKYYCHLFGDFLEQVGEDLKNEKRCKQCLELFNENNKEENKQRKEIHLKEAKEMLKDNYDKTIELIKLQRERDSIDYPIFIDDQICHLQPKKKITVKGKCKITKGKPCKCDEGN